MNVSVIIVAQASEMLQIENVLRNVLDQDYTKGLIEVIVVQYGRGVSAVLEADHKERGVRFCYVDRASGYSARNIAARDAMGQVLLFTEPGCAPDRGWISAHVAVLSDPGVSVSIGHVAPARTTWPVDMLLAYENLRDAWVFSCPDWMHYFGRPKNMAVKRERFESHGPFVDVMRGADSMFVQRVARELSCGEIGLAPNAIVYQKSVRSLWGFLRDRFAHARALRIYASSHAKPLQFDQRMNLFRGTLEKKHYGTMRAAGLALLLGAGVLAFRLGGWAGAPWIRWAAARP